MDFLTLGHITRDLVPGGYTVGGTVTYASVAAMRLGWKPGVITRTGPDIDLPDVYNRIELLPLPSEKTTTFQNIYTPTGRVQKLHTVAWPIGPEDIPSSWQREPKIVLLGPLANEIKPDVSSMFPDALVGVVPQGWMRAWNEQGLVSPKPWDSAEEILPHVDVLVLSFEDIDHDLGRAEHCWELLGNGLMVLTRGRDGCDVYFRGDTTRVEPRPAEEVDPTGAGDVFAAAFLIRLFETGDPLNAARFANVAASFNIEGSGIDGIPERGQIENWLAEHPD
ncbi:MAG: PfkB family carbohydrate kinase [Chloroflexota bacterium]|nr:PfkB family carbohydrate kinase [Chloroflexota bacterium]